MNAQIKTTATSENYLLMTLFRDKRDREAVVKLRN